MRTIHFVYAVPRPRSWFIRGVLRAYQELSNLHLGLPPWYRYRWIPEKMNPMSAPGSITINLYRYLRQRVSTLLYDWDERKEIKFRAGDIIVGHPHPNHNTVIQKTLRSDRKCKLKALIFPMHHAIESINEYTLPLLAQADMVFGIMGPYWYDTLDNSFFAPWKDKIVRLDMAVDADRYPLLKRSFNPPGRRGYLYIGSNRPEKGCDVLSRVMAQLGDFPRAWIGRGADIPYVQRIAASACFTPRFVSQLAREYDVFVNTSISDANPTTILEAMAWGFPIACTPQSGYYRMPSIITLSTTDIEANVEALLDLQYAPEEDLLHLSTTNRKLVETEYTWQYFCTKVWENLEPFVSG